MPCYRCGTRQVDPVRGASPWKKAVRNDALVLVCPECHQSSLWKSEIDQCVRCHSTELTCRLGEVECRECGFSRPAGHDAGGATPEVPGLSEEVEAALDRVLRRGYHHPVHH